MAAEEWDKLWVTDFTETEDGDGRTAKRRMIQWSEARYQAHSIPQDDKGKLKFATRVRELNFLTYGRHAPHFTRRYITELSEDKWKELKQNLSHEIQPPDEWGGNALDCLPGPLGSPFENEYKREMGRTIKKEKSGRRKQARNRVSSAVKNGEVSGPETESAKLDTTETTPADVNKFGEPVAGHLNKHRKAITNSEATYKGELGQAVGNEEVLRQFARLSLKHQKITKQLKRSGADLEELGRELQSCVDSLTPAQANAPESAGS
jgi:hypothetical protein